MDVDAKSYDELSRPQYESGCKFINEINLSPGDKVLDMGCGTGDLTKYIADIVGSDGQVIGIDPDEKRINIAKEKYKDVSNLKFHVGSTVTGFPYDGEPFYDVHITTHAFHWFPHDEKKLYIQKAHHSLKNGGKLTILCSERVGPQRNDQYAIIDIHPLSEDEFRKLFQEGGLFTNVEVRKAYHDAHYESQDMFKRWAKASSHHDMDELDPTFVKDALGDFLKFHDDGTVTFKMPNISIIAVKE